MSEDLGEELVTEEKIESWVEKVKQGRRASHGWRPQGDKEDDMRPVDQRRG